MNELITINYENEEQPTVSGRELWEALGVNSNYTTWFTRMAEYGFTEGEDFIPILEESTGGRPSIDHKVTIPMAKELCMLQRTEKGKEIRRYFISVEEQWNSPEAIMARALRIADMKLLEAQGKVKVLETTVAVQTQQIAELTPKAGYYDVILSCKDAIAISVIAKDYGKTAQWMNEKLHELGVQFKSGKIWLLYKKYAEQGYTCTRTTPYPKADGTQGSSVHTYWTQKGRIFIYDLLKQIGILPVIERNSNEPK